MSESENTPVVITGVGVLSPIGIGADAFREGLKAGKPGFGRPELLDFIGTPDCIGGEISEFTEASAKKHYLRPLRKSVKLMCREIQLGVAAALQAMEHAGLQKGDYDPQRAGVSFGANLMSSPPQVMARGVSECLDDQGRFVFDRWGQHGMRGMEPLWLLCYLPNMPGCHIGIALDARGPNNSITHDEASGGLAIAEAVGILQRDRADVMVAGVTGTRLHNVKACQSAHWDVLATGPAETRCRPLAVDRTGEVLAESACCLILETRRHAEERGARILGTILGTGASCHAGRKNGTGTDEQAAVRQAARRALEKSGLTPHDLGHVNLGASGHPQRDLFEAAGVRQLLEDDADRVPVTAPKSYFGSAASGSSLAELAASLFMLQDGIIPRTLNCDQPDPEIGLSVVTSEDHRSDRSVFLKTSVTRMGQASAVVVQV